MQLQGWSAPHSFQHGVLFQTGQDKDKVLPSVFLGLKLQKGQVGELKQRDFKKYTEERSKTISYQEEEKRTRREGVQHPQTLLRFTHVLFPES